MLLQEVFHTVYRRDKLAYCFLESFIAEKIVVMIRLDVTRKENINKEILRAGIIAELDAINIYEQVAGCDAEEGY